MYLPGYIGRILYGGIDHIGNKPPFKNEALREILVKADGSSHYKCDYEEEADG